MSESPSSQPLVDAPASPSDRDTQDPPMANPDLDMDISDNERDIESDLSEVDEAEFEDFDPNAVTIEDRPRVDLDEDVVRTLTAKKKKRDGDAAPKKPKEGKRAKKKRTDDNDGADGEIMREKRKSKGAGAPRSEDSKERAKERRLQAARDEQLNEDQLTPDERRRRALDRAMDAALKNPNKRRRKRDEVDLEDAADDEIAAIKVRMEEACQSDNQARDDGKPAVHKLKMLPEVVSLMNRNTVQHTLVDPDTNFLQAVKFFLEPLNDGSLPAYSIQRDLFNSLTRLPIEKEALRSSGIGKLMVYYTKSKRPELSIKRIAERLINDWSRPILKQSDDYKKRKIETREFDAATLRLASRPAASQTQSSQQPQLSQRDRERERMLAPNRTSNRARLDGSAISYSVAPRSSYVPGRVDPSSRPIGAGGDAAFREMLGKKSKRG